MSVPVLTLREALDYNPQTGLFFWRERPVHHFCNDMRWSAQNNCNRWNSRFAEKECFTTKQRNGYLSGVVDCTRLLAHRVAWAITAGSWPPDTVDHINGQRGDNRLCNLRLATRKEQSRNCASSKSSTSSFLGVSWRSDRKVWRAVIGDGSRQVFLGTFSDETEAAKAYDEAAKELHGVFARLNFPAGPQPSPATFQAT